MKLAAGGLATRAQVRLASVLVAAALGACLGACLSACQPAESAPTAAPQPTLNTVGSPGSYQPECFLEDDRVSCQDGQIGVEFRYPASWGFLTAANLQAGECGGQSLVYSFDPWWTGPQNGGASRDFCQPGADSLQSFAGFPAELPGSPDLSVCQQVFPQAVFCQIVSEQTWLVGLFPDAQAVCLAPSGRAPLPRLAVAINLPQGRPVGGLVLAQVFLSPEGEASLFEPLGGPSPNRGLCRTESATGAYQANVKDLAQAILEGRTDPVTLARVEAIRRLAESVRID